MGAIVCEIKDWESPGFEIANASLFARGVRVANQRRCPCCESIIYTRRHKVCSVCGSPLPDACLFSPEEANSVERLLKEERSRHRKWLNRFSN